LIAVGGDDAAAVLDAQEIDLGTAADDDGTAETVLTVGEVQSVLHELLREGVSIRDLVTICETLADRGRQTKDIDALTEARLVRRITPPGSVARYESRVGDNHHHAVCRSCGAIADVDCAVGEAPCLHASDDSGFAIDEAEVIYWGLCPACSTRS